MIDHPASAELLKTLQIKAGARLWLVNAPVAIAEALTAGAEVEPVKADEPYDGALVFCETAAEVDAIAGRLLEGLPEDGLLWFAYRDGQGGLSADAGWDALESGGWKPVDSVLIAGGWTGIRFRRNGGKPDPAAETRPRAR